MNSISNIAHFLKRRTIRPHSTTFVRRFNIQICAIFQLFFEINLSPNQSSTHKHAIDIIVIFYQHF